MYWKENNSQFYFSGEKNVNWDTLESIQSIIPGSLLHFIKLCILEKIYPEKCVKWASLQLLQIEHVSQPLIHLDFLEQSWSYFFCIKRLKNK